MCFAPQRRALFRHLNVKKWSEPLVFWHSWLGNVLRATTMCTFSSLIWPAALARLLFDPPEPQVIGKTELIATFLPFRAPASSFFWLSPSLIFSLLDFSSLTLPTSAFPSLHIVGSLTSKLPSNSGQSTILPCYCNFPVVPGKLQGVVEHRHQSRGAVEVFGATMIATQRRMNYHIPCILYIYIF